MEILGSGAAKCNINFQIGSYRSIIFDFGIDVSSWTFEFILRKNKGDRIKIIDYTLTNGITFVAYQSDQILVSFSSLDTSIEEGEYYFELRRTDISIPLVNGLAFFAYDANEGSSTDVALSLTVTSQTINATISNNILPSGAVVLQGVYNASSGILPTPSNKGYLWIISVGGSFGGVTVDPGAKLLKLNNDDDQTLSNWNFTF